MLSLAIFCLFTNINSLTISETRLSIFEKPSVYQVPRNYDLPSGLLPKGVKNYDLDLSTGKFAAYFNNSCSFSVEGPYQLNYKPAIRGFISNRKLESLEGLSTKLFSF
ncbi:hypothetical protein L484_001571 [Morus notabilis]|uniref:Uncharacterized protein n=1 Tax=Morus notabilis TaxID=981085 RepID=W9RJR6_9ROSA|nr:hypothetical protein L484_003060 [Morus notabilis]EXC04308.1 hypothetical protein L484_001571 [Morus notabilis]